MTKPTVLITGATRGLGLAFAAHYIGAGWRVIACARDPTGSNARALGALAPDRLVQLDVGDEHSITRCATVDLAGERVDLLINNAGILERETLENTCKPTVMRQFEINAVGPMLVTRAFRQHLKLAVSDQGLAKVVHVSSLLGSISANASGGMYGYRASKAALNMINASLARDLRSEGIMTLVYHPGYVATDMNQYKGTVQAGDSVKGMTQHIETMKMDGSGKFFDYTGKELEW